MQKQSLLLVVLLVFGLLMLLTACSGIHEKSKGMGTLKLALSSSNQLQQGALPQTVSDKIVLSKFIVTATKNSTVITQEVPYNGSTTAELVLTNLATGPWKIDVVALDVDGYKCYGGSATPTVTTGTTTVVIPLNLLDGNLDVTVRIPIIHGLNITSGQVTLANPVTGEHVVKSLAINGTEGVVDYGLVNAGTWYVEVDLFDGETKLAWGSCVITVLPDRNNHAIIEFTGTLQGGDLNVIIVVSESPSDPTGLTGSMENNSVTLSWNPNPESNVAGYAVYRATSESGFKKLLTYTLISNTTYVDTDIQADEQYYYWVQVYNTDGYSSELSLPYFVNTAQPMGNPIVINYDQFTNAIYVNVNTGDDTLGNGSESNPYQSVIKASSMVTASNTAVVVTGVGTYTIPNLDSLIKPNIHVNYIVDPKLFGDVIFELQNTTPTWDGTIPRISMSAFNNFYGIIFKRVVVDNIFPCYENFSKYAKMKLNLYNCVFANSPLIICGFPLRVGIYSDPVPNEVYYKNCSFYHSFQSEDGFNNYTEGNFINCSFTQSIFTKDAHNLHNVTYNLVYKITSSGWQNIGTGLNPDGTNANIGVYGGQYAWGLW